jgi:hypothetical protein
MVSPNSCLLLNVSWSHHIKQLWVIRGLITSCNKLYHLLQPNIQSPMAGQPRWVRQFKDVLETFEDGACPGRRRTSVTEGITGGYGNHKSWSASCNYPIFFIPWIVDAMAVHTPSLLATRPYTQRQVMGEEDDGWICNSLYSGQGKVLPLNVIGVLWNPILSFIINTSRVAQYYWSAVVHNFSLLAYLRHKLDVDASLMSLIL